MKKGLPALMLALGVPGLALGAEPETLDLLGLRLGSTLLEFQETFPSADCEHHGWTARPRVFDTDPFDLEEYECRAQSSQLIPELSLTAIVTARFGATGGLFRIQFDAALPAGAAMAVATLAGEVLKAEYGAPAVSFFARDQAGYEADIYHWWGPTPERLVGRIDAGRLSADVRLAENLAVGFGAAWTPGLTSYLSARVEDRGAAAHYVVTLADGLAEQAAQDLWAESTGTADGQATRGLTVATGYENTTDIAHPSIIVAPVGHWSERLPIRTDVNFYVEAVDCTFDDDYDILFNGGQLWDGAQTVQGAITFIQFRSKTPEPIRLWYQFGDASQRCLIRQRRRPVAARHQPRPARVPARGPYSAPTQPA